MNRTACVPRWLFACLAALPLLLAAGCVRMHIPRPSAPGEPQRIQELSEHVDFLTQPALKGRKCRSLEAGYVRQYLRQQFEAFGLVPWPRTSGFDQSFGFGTNVIGVLAGADRTLSREIVLVCAHYDGQGVVNGKMHPGAADDAAGVAILLQTAQRLAADRPTLRRSVAFAALDCGQERYLGAFALTMRKDFDPQSLAAVIDLDMLGRPNFDVIADTLIVAGTDGYPDIRQAVHRAAAQAPATTRAATTSQAATQSTQATQAAPLRILPGGSDVLPPIADYFAFQQWRLPVLLLTNGIYSDYHKPTDTADRLDYGLLQRDADVTVQLVKDLAAAPARPQYIRPTAGDREELQGLLFTVEQVLAHADDLSLVPIERVRLGQVARRARQLLARPHYSLADRKAFLVDLAEKGAASILRFFYSPPKPDPARLIAGHRLAGALSWYEFFMTHRPFAARATQQVIRHFIEARGNLLRLLSTYTFSSCDIGRDEIVLARLDGDQSRLSFIYPRLRIQAGISTRDFDVQYAPADFRGTESDLVDACLLYWSAGDPECMAAIMPAVLSVLTGRNEDGGYDLWLAWRLDQVPAADEHDWQRRLWQSDNPDILKILLKKAAARNQAVPEDSLRRIIADRGLRPDVRADAIAALPSSAGSQSLLALADVLDDRAAIQLRQYLPAFDPTFPFHGHAGMREARLRPLVQPAASVAAAAYNKLKTLTGQALPASPEAWRQWLATEGAGG